jgi:hypothetical protein
VIANARKPQHYALTLKDVFLALAKEVPNPDGSRRWCQPLQDLEGRQPRPARQPDRGAGPAADLRHP